MRDFEQAWGAFAFAVVLFSQLAVLEKERCAVRAQKNSAFRPLICQRSKRSVHFALFLPSACWCATVCADQAARGGGAAAASARTSTSARGARCISHVGCARHAPCTPISARAARIARRLCRARRPRSTRCAHHARRPRSTRRVCGAHIARRF